MSKPREGQIQTITVLDENNEGQVTFSGANATEVSSINFTSRVSQPSISPGTGSFWVENNGGESIPKFTDSNSFTITVGANLSSLLINDSGVSGVSISDALNTMNISNINTSSSLSNHISNSTNPHSTSLSNLLPGTLAELNSIITDANIGNETLSDILASGNATSGYDILLSSGDDIIMDGGSLINSISVIFNEQASVPGTTPVVGTATLWSNENTENNSLILTKSDGYDRFVESYQYELQDNESLGIIESKYNKIRVETSSVGAYFDVFNLPTIYDGNIPYCIKIKVTVHAIESTTVQSLSKSITFVRDGSDYITRDDTVIFDNGSAITITPNDGILGPRLETSATFSDDSRIIYEYEIIALT